MNSVSSLFKNDTNQRSVLSRRNYLPSRRLNDDLCDNLYVFDQFDSADEELNDRFKEYELTNIRHRNPAAKNESTDRKSNLTDYLVHTIKDGDTLQSLSLTYEVPVGEIKRVNNIISNQEFFGLKTVRIPTVKYGLLLELDDGATVKPQEGDNALVRTLSIGQFLKDEKDDAAAFLKRMDEDLSRIRSAAAKRTSLDEATQPSAIYPLVIEEPEEETTSSSVSWQTLLILILVGCVLAPLIAISYLLQTGSDATNQTIPATFSNSSE